MKKRIAGIVEMMLAFVFVLMLVGVMTTTEKAKADIGYSFSYDGTSQTLAVTLEGSGELRVNAEFIYAYCFDKTIDSIKKLVVNVSPSAVTWEGNITVGAVNPDVWRFDEYPATKSLEEVVVHVPGAKISDEAFAYLEKLTTVDLGSEDSVTEIGKIAFAECPLTSITLPDSLTTIKDDAFNSCEKLESITLPNSVETIGNETFCKCYSLKEVDLSSSSLKSIGDSAFAGCPIESISMPDTVESIGKQAFHPCYHLEEVKFSSSLKSIGDSAFYECPIANLSLPDKLESIGENAFHFCREKVLIIPDSVNSIGESAFGANGNLEELYIGKNALNGATGEKAFAWCSKLKKVVFSENSECTTIPYGTFLEDGSLTKIEIPASATTIEENAFMSCSSLNTVIFKGETVPAVNADAFKEADKISMIVVPNKDEYEQNLPSALADKVITEEEYIAIISKPSSGDVNIPVVIDSSLLGGQGDNADDKVEEQDEDKTDDKVDEDVAKTDEEPEEKLVKKPKTAKITAIKRVRGGFKLTWKKLGKNVKGLQIQYSTSKNFKKGNKKVIVSSKKTSKTVKGLKAGKKYFVRVRTYKLVDGKKVFSKWSAKKSVLTN